MGKNWVREDCTLFPYEPPLERRRVSNQVWAPWLVSAPLGSARLAYHQLPQLGSRSTINAVARFLALWLHTPDLIKRRPNIFTIYCSSSHP
jgi:hypothetical protein